MQNLQQKIRNVHAKIELVHGIGDHRFIGLDGKKYAVRREKPQLVKAKNDNFRDLFENDFEDEEDSYWTFDENSASVVYGSDIEDQSMLQSEDEEPVFEYDLSREGDNVTDLTITKTRYRNLKVLNRQVMVMYLSVSPSPAP